MKNLVLQNDHIDRASSQTKSLFQGLRAEDLPAETIALGTVAALAHFMSDNLTRQQALDYADSLTEQLHLLEFNEDDQAA